MIPTPVPEKYAEGTSNTNYRTRPTFSPPHPMSPSPASGRLRTTGLAHMSTLACFAPRRCYRNSYSLAPSRSVSRRPWVRPLRRAPAEASPPRPLSPSLSVLSALLSLSLLSAATRFPFARVLARLMGAGTWRGWRTRWPRPPSQGACCSVRTRPSRSRRRSVDSPAPLSCRGLRTLCRPSARQ